MLQKDMRHYALRLVRNLALSEYLPLEPAKLHQKGIDQASDLLVTPRIGTQPLGHLANSL
jgi:hypothetical protein